MTFSALVNLGEKIVYKSIIMIMIMIMIMIIIIIITKIIIIIIMIIIIIIRIIRIIIIKYRGVRASALLVTNELRYMYKNSF